MTSLILEVFLWFHLEGRDSHGRAPSYGQRIQVHMSFEDSKAERIAPVTLSSFKKKAF
jgi:hypothetical protein